MRRFAAHLGLAAIYIGLFAPFAIAAQQSSLHACCLRTGAHHCQADSSEAGFHSAANTCPYAAQLLPTTYSGLEAEKFRISSPDVAALVTHQSYHSHSASAIRDLPARAPPSSLL